MIDDASIETWEQLAAHVRNGYAVRREAEGRLVVDVVNGTDKTRLVLKYAEGFGEPWLVVQGKICAVADVQADEALAYNSTTAVGVIAFEEDRCVLRWTTAVVGLSPAELDRALATLAADVRSLRRWVEPERKRVALFEAYAT